MTVDALAPPRYPPLQMERHLPHRPTASTAPQRLPRTIDPMTPAQANEPFDSAAHLFEVLWEGVRAILFVEGRSVRLQDRFGRDITDLFPELAHLHRRIARNGTVLDGIIVALDSDGRPLTRALVPRFLPGGADRPEAHIAFQAVDILYRDNESVMNFTLRRRKEILREAVRPGDRIAVPDHLVADGIALYEAARQHGLAGTVAKELNSGYYPGRDRRSWLSVRVYPSRNFIVGGFTFGGPWRGKRAAKHRGPIESVLVGLYGESGDLHFAGEASGNFKDDPALVDILDSIVTPGCPFVHPPSVEKLVYWCRPQFAASVRYADWTVEGRLRFPIFETLRPDVPPETCTLL